MPLEPQDLMVHLGIKTAAVVLNVHDDPSILFADLGLDLRGISVPDRVGDRLLKDADKGQGLLRLQVYALVDVRGDPDVESLSASSVRA